MTNNDLAFLSRIMGAPFAGAPEKLPAWYAAAASNPEKRAAGIGRLAGLLEMLPTEEDAARTPVVEERRAGAITARQLPDGLCACGSPFFFADCHGADA